MKRSSQGERVINSLVHDCIHPIQSCWKLVHALIKQYEWVHLIIGILGNIAFLGGSIMMLQEEKTTAIYLFIAGSSGMLIGNLGRFLISLGRDKHR